MAFCAHCGKQIPDNAKFCDGCGQPTIGAPGAGFANQGFNNQGVNNQGFNNQGFNNQGFADQSANNQQYGTFQANRQPDGRFLTPIVARIKELGGSTLELVLIILMAAAVVFSFIAGGSSMIPGLGGGMIVITIIGCVPSILTIIGLLLFWLDCRNNTVPIGKGLGLYRASKIVMIVYLALIGVVAVIAMLFGGALAAGLGGAFGSMFDEMLGSSSYGYGAVAGVFAGVIIFVVVIIGALLFLAILMQVKLMRSANIVRDTLASGVRSGTIPVYPVVIEILITIGLVISLISTIGQMASVGSYLGGYYTGILAVSVISSIITVAQAVLTVMMLMKLRAAVNQNM